MQESKSSKGNKIAIVILVIVTVLLTVGLVASYFYFSNKSQGADDKNQAQIKKLNEEITNLNNQLKTNSTNTGSSNNNTSTSTTNNVPSANTLANIKDAIKSGNTAALEGYMAPTVLVILAASEGVGNRTPAQAISDLKYLNSATLPWNFDLDTATLAKYANGDYKTYFKTNTLVGKSANDYVVAFNFNEAGKINGIFMAVNSSLL